MVGGGRGVERLTTARPARPLSLPSNAWCLLAGRTTTAQRQNPARLHRPRRQPKKRRSMTRSPSSMGPLSGADLARLRQIEGEQAALRAKDTRIRTRRADAPFTEDRLRHSVQENEPS
jgi:hypothetical protein